MYIFTEHFGAFFFFFTFSYPHIIVRSVLYLDSANGYKKPLNFYKYINFSIYSNYSFIIKKIFLE